MSSEGEVRGEVRGRKRERRESEEGESKRKRGEIERREKQIIQYKLIH